MPLVLVLKIAPGLRTVSTFDQSARLMARSSVTASMIQSQSFDFARSSSKFPRVTSELSESLKKAAGLAFRAAVKSVFSGQIAGRLIGKNNIEKVSGYPGVSKVSGDAGAHGASAKNGYAADRFHAGKVKKAPVFSLSQAKKFGVFWVIRVVRWP